MSDVSTILAGCTVIDADTNDELPGVPDLALYAVTRGGDFGEREQALARFREGVWHHVPAHHEDWHRRHGHELVRVRVESADDRREAAEGAAELRRQLEAEERHEYLRELEYDRQEEIGVSRWRGLDD
jgi:hypothetical protein